MRLACAVVWIVWCSGAATAQTQHSLATHWNEQVLEAIRNDLARPVVHARNLLHTSVAMYDCFAAYAPGTTDTYFLGKTWDGFACPFAGVPVPSDPAAVKSAQETAMSYAVYRLIINRFSASPDWASTSANINAYMAELGLDPNYTSTDYLTGGPAALGNYVASKIIAFGLQDGSNQQNNYAATCYTPINPNLQMQFPGNPNMVDPNRWQRVEVPLFIDQSGNVLTSVPNFIGPEWGRVAPFSLDPDWKEVLQRDGCTYEVYLNPGPPSMLDTTSAGGMDDLWKWNHVLVSIWQSHHDPYDGVLWDVSPGGRGGSDGSFPTDLTNLATFYDLFEGGSPVAGHPVNPVTGEPYAPELVPRGDFTRCVAEYWADGPDSETPPGHWFTIVNDVMAHPLFEYRWRGQGPLLDPLEYSVKAYLALGGAMHDAAIATWSVKGYYDSSRPVSAIRYMAEKGQCSDPSLDNYHPAGLPLIPGYVEVVEPGDPLAGTNGSNVGEIKLWTWRGPDYVEVPLFDEAGVGWILAKNWWPYQRPTFVSPPFAGYLSGHSTYSRAGAEVLTLLTGTPYFPGGLGTKTVQMNQYLVFEDGPSMTFDLQWATYYDASNQSSLSRIWGGIHPPMDDGRGRAIGSQVAVQAFHCAEARAFPQWAMECGGDGFLPGGNCVCDFNYDSAVNIGDLLLFLAAFSNYWTGPYDLDNNGSIGTGDLLLFLGDFGQACE